MTETVTPNAGRPIHWIEADAYLFDIDGTLLNARDGVHYNAFHSALRKVYGVDARIDTVPVHGNTDVGILRAVTGLHGVAVAEFECRLKEAAEHMCNSARRNAADMAPKVCPDVAELLGRLKAQHKLLGVVSGNFEAIGWMKLQAAGLREFFDFGSFSGDRELRVDIFRHGVAEARRRLGAKSRVCIVGDTPADVSAAKQLEIPIIAVGTGIYSVEQLADGHPELCVSCCTDLLVALTATAQRSKD
jgi:phosphoglycolate phosphatase-like HAD superfamily hydrolase